MVAAAFGGVEVLAALLAADADIEVVDRQGSTALHAAAGVTDSNLVVALLLSAGARADCANRLGQLPADVALAAEEHRGEGAASCLRVRMLRVAAAHPKRQGRLAAARPSWDDSDAEGRAEEARELKEAAKELMAAGGEKAGVRCAGLQRRRKHATLRLGQACLHSCRRLPRWAATRCAAVTPVKFVARNLTPPATAG